MPTPLPPWRPGRSARYEQGRACVWGGIRGDAALCPRPVGERPQALHQATRACASLPPHCRGQDCEMQVHGTSLASPAFQRALYCALRALIDELGAKPGAGCW